MEFADLKPCPCTDFSSFSFDLTLTLKNIYIFSENVTNSFESSICHLT